MIGLFRRKIRSTALRVFNVLENNNDPDIRTNGEQWLIQRLLSRLRGSIVLIDAGASVGNYTLRLLEECERCGLEYEIHLFEPSPDCASTLRQRFAPNVRIHVNTVGVSDSVRHAPLFFDAPGSSFSSLSERPSLRFEHSTRVKLIRLDGYLKKKRIKTVDFLKLDVEGHELHALRGLGRFLHPDAVRVIQFEYGGANLDSHTTLADLYAMLEQRGYRLAKLRRRGLEYRPYEPWMDNFQYANYVALAPNLNL